MLYLEEKYNTERINYKCPKSTLILSKNISLKKNNLENELNLNDNDNNYVINSVKLQNYYQNTNIYNLQKTNSIQQNTRNDKIYPNSIRIRNLTEFSDIQNNTESSNKIYTDKNMNNVIKNGNKYNENYIINNSLNNHIQNFLRKYRGNKNNNYVQKENNEKELGNNYDNGIKLLNQKYDSKTNKLNKENLFEVMKELKIVSYKKLNKSINSERTSNNLQAEISDVIKNEKRVFSQNRNMDKKHISYKYFNEISNKKKEDYIKKENPEKEKLSKKFNLKKINIKKIKGKNLNNYNIINNNLNEKKIIPKTYTLTRMNQSNENRKKFKIKSIENQNNPYKNQNNKSCNFNRTINDSKNIFIKNLRKKQNNRLIYKKQDKNKINIERNSNIVNNKYHITEEGEPLLMKYNETFSNLIEDKNYFSGLSTLLKSDGNIYLNKRYSNNENSDFFSNNSRPKNNYIMNNNLVNPNDSINMTKDQLKHIKISNLNFNENSEIFNEMDLNILNNSTNYSKFKNKLNKSLNYNKRQHINDDEFSNIYSDQKEKQKKNIFIKKIEPMNLLGNNTIEMNNNYIPKNNIIINNINQRKYNNINRNIYKINKTSDIFKKMGKIEEKNKNIKENLKINNLNTNQINDKTKNNLDKKYRTEKNLLNNKYLIKFKTKKPVDIMKIYNKKNNNTINLDDSDIIDINRLDLKIENHNKMYKKINKYNNPNSTTNDIVNMINKKDIISESNNSEYNFNESVNSIYTNKYNNNINNVKNNKINNVKKDLDLSHLNSVFNSRFQYNTEKKKSINNKVNEKNINNNFIIKKLEKKLSNYFCLDKAKENVIDAEKNGNLNTKFKKIKKKNLSEKIIKGVNYNDSKYNKYNKDENQLNKYKEQQKKGENILNKNDNDNIYRPINSSKKMNSINYKNNELFSLYNEENKNISKVANKKMNISGNMYFYPNSVLGKDIYKSKVSINKKSLTNRNIVPNLYTNLYKSKNINKLDTANTSDNDKIYKLSDSDNLLKNQYYSYNNNNKYSKMYNYIQTSSFKYPKNNSLQYFPNDNNIINNKSNISTINDFNNFRKKNNQILNLNNNFIKNKIIKKMDKKQNKNSNKYEQENNQDKNEIEEEEIEIEESEEESNEEEEAQSTLREEKTNTNTTFNIYKNPKDKYLLELKENGLPDLPKNKILSCNIGSLINISIYNGLPISSNISLITDSFQMFPTSDFVENLIKESSNNDQNRNNLNNEYFEKKVNSYQKYPSIINIKIFFQIICERPGNITFLFMYKDEKDNNKIKFTEPFYILVNPLIEINKGLNENDNNKNIIELTQIRMQTVISKNIGKIKNDFDNYYEEASLLGYNFIHFKTLQNLSSSENLYSIKDHHELNNSFFTETNKNIVLTQEKKNELFQNYIRKYKQKYNIGAITDVILTQASTESEWILSHPECAYNLENCPWLNVAYKLDEILVNYSNLFYNKKVSSNCAPYINNVNDLEETMEEIGNEVHKNNLEEYFLIPIQEYIDKFKIFYNNYLLNQDKDDYIIKKSLLINEIKKDYSLRESNYGKIMNNDNDNNCELLMNESIIYDIISQSCKNYGYKRYGVEMPIELISLLIIEKYRIKSKNNELINNFEFLKEIKNYINLINKEWYEKSKEMIKIALLNVKEFIRYQFIQLNRIGIKRQLIDSYFYVINKNDPKKILLCNGWIMQSEDSSNYYPDITAYGTWYYFKRKVIIWKDTIKINYNENITKTPEFLLNYMTKYITFLANTFEGLYIESLANLPMFILKYFIHKARQVNPNIIFMTQLPTIDDEMDEDNNNDDGKNNKIQKYFEKTFSEQLGINLFVHEIIWDCSNNEIVKNILSNVNSNSNMTEGKLISKFNSNLYSMSKTSDNKIFFGCYKYLKYHKPFCILYDLTQDNQSYYEKYNILSIQNSMMGSISMLDCAIGSTRGFDQLFPYQVSSQKEQRLYYFENNKIKNIIKKVINIKNNDPNKQLQDVIFELHTSNIILNESDKNINIDLNNINSVKLALSYHKWKPDIFLDKINKSLFMIKVKLPIGKHFYKYVIDEKLWVCDSSKPVEIDEGKNMNNILNLNYINSLQVPDITLLRCYINSIREKFKNKNSEIFLQRNNDLLCIIRMMIDSKSLINNNIDDNIVNEYKNNMKFQPTYHISKNDDRNIINNNIHNINFNNNINNNVNKNINYNNINKDNLDYNKLINDELNLYEGYAIITRPTYNIIDDNEGKGEIIIPGKIDSLICSFSLSKEEDFEMNNILDKQYLLGINGNIFFNKDINYLKQISTFNYNNGKTIIRFHVFPANSILILRFSLDNEIMNIVDNLYSSIEILFNKGDKFVDKYDLCDINKILYKTDKEEKEWSFQKRGTYELSIIDDKNLINKNKEYKLQNSIKFIYSGIHQIMDIIKKIKRKEKQNILFNDDINNINGNIESILNDKKFIQSLYNDLADHDYLLDYILERINNINSFSLMNDYIKNNIQHSYKLLPYHLKPIFFELIIISLYQNIIRISLQKIPFSILNFGDFATALSLCRYEFFGQINPNSSFVHDLSKRQNNLIPNISISKGIPNNVVGSERVYFRDILIGFKSLFLISNSYSEGKNILKIIGSCLRHGLIPDYFDNGEKPRYNSRDTCWYYINAIKNYIYYSKDYKFLKEEIGLIFISDINFNDHLQKKIKGEEKKYTLENIIHIIFQSHAKGIHFREWDYSNNNYFINNSYLKKEGYNIDIELDPNTGFIYGGNYCNNGTWMNKLGNSIKGKNKGTPATPRPGADIEIIALVYSCLDFVVDMGNKNYFKYKSVELSNGMNYPYSQWKLLIKDSFEDEFFVKKYNIDINNNNYSNNQIKGNIYKDYKNKNNVNIYEFQLRPNFLIALYISPELFTYKNIINSLKNVELYLLRDDNNVIGLKTLDKTDKEYNGLYDNRESSNFFTSCGFNIHNGIEHTWLYGVYLILKIKYFYNNNNKITPDGNEEDNQNIIKFASNKLIPIMNIIKNNKWFGIPEMTDELGYIIMDGNQSDLKAMAIFFELIEILSKLDLENENDYSNEYNENSNLEM